MAVKGRPPLFLQTRLSRGTKAVSLLGWNSGMRNTAIIHTKKQTVDSRVPTHTCKMRTADKQMCACAPPPPGRKLIGFSSSQTKEVIIHKSGDCQKSHQLSFTSTSPAASCPPPSSLAPLNPFPSFLSSDPHVPSNPSFPSHSISANTCPLTTFLLPSLLPSLTRSISQPV